jgi:hypothetical protein
MNHLLPNSRREMRARQVAVATGGIASTRQGTEKSMKRIAYCGESFLTTDGAADALLELVVAFPDGHASELFELPALNRDGDEMVVQVVVGPGSELVSMPEVSGMVEPDTLSTVAYLRGRTRELTVPNELSYSEALSFVEYGWGAQPAL